MGRGKFVDLTGQRFGRLVVVEYAGSDKHGIKRWACNCDCGKQRTVIGSDLKSGNTKSCGCLAKEIHNTIITKHGDCGKRLYRIWRHMLNRCYCKSNNSYFRYGGRGITVCDEWRTNYINFKEWALRNGYNDNLTIDRIDNNKGYNPLNCQWSTPAEQARNKRNSIYIKYENKTLSLNTWANELGINQNTLRARLRRGWSIEKSFETPIRENRRYH